MSEVERTIDNAKRADTAAVSYALRNLWATSEFKNLDSQAQERRVEAKKTKVALKRVRDGKHATVVQQRLGIGEGGGAYSLWDDGNIAWETEDEDDEVVQEAMWREDEKANGVDDVGIQKIQREMVAQSVATTKKVDQLGFSLWRRKWRVAYQSTIYYNKVPPHLYFSKTEMAVWRNFTSWNLDGDNAYLPGPAEWYPDDYYTTQHGFHVDLDAGRAYEAWEMLAEETEPTNFRWVLPSDDTLVLLPPTKESEEFLSQFYEM
ncbi:hypothetical protein GMDG_05458 [Pseudogymnoascus destructans 20631-21]|uniref:Uncharacterized protein n=1 Tax=Pseudogymnoascus destructans (strain ATCC MYA-4855 / 20631-21) TaxID=658429 RepID=L8FN51_PSED2|nr:hypothetical protein GMDG_05458 [Pseudogymnoascus destructans 20631-21]